MPRRCTSSAAPLHLALRLARILLAGNKAPTTVAIYGEAVRVLDAYLQAHMLPARSRS